MKLNRIKQRAIDKLAPVLATRLQRLAAEEGIDMQVQIEPANARGEGALLLSGPDLQRFEVGDWQTTASGTLSRILAQLKRETGAKP